MNKTGAEDFSYPLPDALTGLEEAARPGGNKPRRSSSQGKTRKSGEANPHYLDHRERLRARFATDNGASLPDYELLELVLTRSIPRRDVKPLAKALIERFGSFAEVLGAREERLQEVSGVGLQTARDLKIVAAAAARMSRGEVARRKTLSSWKDVIDYCRSAMAYDEHEVFRVLFLDKRNRLIKDEVQGKGTVDHVPVYVREVVKRALELSSTAIILVHNHPSGDPTPSTADIRMTQEIAATAKPLGITLHDHIIIGKDGHASFRGLRLLEG